MLRVALRGVFAHKGRLLATLLAVALGVAFIGGVLVLTDTMNESFDDMFATAYEGTDAVVRSSQTIDMGFGTDKARGDVDASLLPTVQAASGVAEAEGVVTGPVQIINQKGDAVGSAFGPPTVGSSWHEVPQLNSWNLRDGVAPTEPGQIVLDAASARTTRYAVGDPVPVQTKQGLSNYTLSGIARFGTSDSLGGANYVLFSTPEAQQVLGQPDKFSSIAVVSDAGVSQDEVVHDLETAVKGDDVEVISGAEITKESQSDLKDQLSIFTNFLLAFAIVAVLVGCFVIYNSFSIVVAQRTREMALLRAVGASRKQVRRAVLIEAVVVGLVGSALGFLLGLGIAKALTSVMDIDASLAVLPKSVLTAMGCGLVVTLVSALVPARKASKVPPVAAMRGVAIDTSGRSLKRFVVGLALLVAGVVGVVIGARQYELVIVGISWALAVFGLIVAGPGLAGPVSALVGRPLRRFRGVTGSLARQNAGRNPKRSAVTAYALMVGVGVVALALVLNASLRASFDKILDESFGASYIIQAGSFGQLGMPHDLALAVAAVPEVESAIPIRQAPVKVDDDASMVTATSPDAFDLFGYKLKTGSDELGDGQAVVLDSVAKSHGLTVGSPLDIEFLNTGTASLTVAGIYKGDETGQSLGDYVLGLDEYTRYVPENTDSAVIVKLEDGVSTAKLKPVLEKVVKPFGTAEVQTADDYKKLIGDSLNVLLSIVLALLVLAFIIAMVGIANTIALSVLERTRELGLLRAVGMARTQLRAAIRWESVIIALFGATLGLGIGLLGGWGFIQALSDDGLGVVRIPVATLLVLAFVAAALGLAAAVIPAWRAGRLKVLDAIHSE